MNPSTRPLLVEIDDLFAKERTKKTQRAQYRLEEVLSPDSKAFEVAYHALYQEFGVQNELERKEVLQNNLQNNETEIPSRSIWIQYHLLVAYDQITGTLAGVRDCYVTLRFPLSQKPLCIVYLAHSLVLPSFRRSGLAAFLRAAPLVCAKNDLKKANVLPSETDIMFAAEMEPVDPHNIATFIRLLSYGRAGFSVISPKSLPYCQPDFRDLSQLHVFPEPIPLLAVVRWVGNENRKFLPKVFAESFVKRLYAIFATHCRLKDLELRLRKGFTKRKHG